MTEIIYYLADDGTRFEDEDECRSYERETKFKDYKNDLVLFNCEERVIKDVDRIGEAVTAMIKTAEALEYFEELSEYYGCCTDGVSGCGLYQWDDDRWRWTNVFDTLNKMQHIVQFTQSFESDFTAED